ncbi:PAS domain S-box protein [Undibacterium sp. LX15W]|uniref:histidine kinase n=1 Tax=Undibacterium flavidum TaxID=2762297 RepID=A0ABR6Y6A4_9BURK|nr:PAS domain S-box protein [Undibacterium flavidum]
MPIIVFVGTGLATELILFEERRRQESVARENIISNAGEIRAIIESQLNTTIYLASGLVSFIKSKDGQYQVQEVEPWLLDLQSKEPSIRNITLAPGNKIQTVVPMTGNESALGLYYPDQQEQWPAIEKIIRSTRPALVGPFELKQGGLGLAYRVPVFLKNGNYWGMISTVLNAKVVFRLAEQRAQQLRLHFSIADLENASNVQIIYGNTKNAEIADRSENRITGKLKLNIPGRNLELIATSSNPHSDFIYTQSQRFAGWLVAILLSLLIAKTLQSYRKQTRAYFALNESQQRFMRAFNTAPQGMALVDTDGKWISANPMLCTILGYEEYELLQKPISDLAEQLSPSALQQQWEHQDKSSLQFELNLRHRDGNSVTCLLSLALIEYENLEKTYWIFQVIDISRRVAAESQLQASAEYTQTILNKVVEGIISASLDGEIRSINPAAMALWKQPEKFYLDTNFFTLICGDHSPHLRAEIQNFIATFAATENNTAKQNTMEQNTDERNMSANSPLYFTRETSITDAQANLVHIEFSLSPLQQKTGTELIIVVRDISERKRLELMQSEFVSIVSHELRTPLTSIIGSLKLIEGGIFGNLPESLARMIHIALQNGQQLALIINDILDMDKLVAGKMDFVIQTLSANQLIAESIENNQSFAREYQVHFNFMRLEQDCLIKADAQRVQQIMSNLLSNAAKFSRPDSKVEINMIKEFGYVKIFVKDHGEGIPEQFQDRLFKKFSQVDGSSTRQKGGTGLGLSICKQMVNRMQGEIAFTSKEGEGSTFYFTLPIADNSAVDENISKDV